jgi:hypothetical protein
MAGFGQQEADKAGLSEAGIESSAVGSRALVPVRISDTVLIDRRINLQTEMVVDQDKTAHLVSLFANGDARMLRISKKGAVKQPVMHEGWPYIVDKRGRLLAMDISWRTILRGKVPVMFRRLGTKFKAAAGSGVALFILGYIDVAIHSGTVGSEWHLPETLGFTGFFSVYLGDALLTAFSRSPYQLGRGGNYFRTVVARDVVGVKPDPDNEGDFIIKFKTADPSGKRKNHLSDLAPDYTKSTKCQFFLTRMLNE